MLKKHTSNHCIWSLSYRSVA